MDVRRFLAWSDALHARWWDQLAKLPADLLAAKVDASFLTPLGILTHMGNIEMAWMDAVEGQPPQWARHSTKKWSELQPVRAYAAEARARTHALVDGLDEAAMRRPCPLEAGVFARPSLTVEEVLFTILTHECHHRGELLAVLWQKDVEPPVSDYPRYDVPL